MAGVETPRRDVPAQHVCPRCGDIMSYEYKCGRNSDVRRWMWWCMSCGHERVDWTRKE